MRKYKEALLGIYAADVNSQIASRREVEALEKDRLHFDKQRHDDLMKSQDRVDISLAEYEKLKNTIARLELKIRDYDRVWHALRMDPDIVDLIVPDTVCVSTGVNLRHCRDAVCIEFEYEPKM